MRFLAVRILLKAGTTNARMAAITKSAVMFVLYHPFIVLRQGIRHVSTPNTAKSPAFVVNSE
jgi:hypothetical protein